MPRRARLGIAPDAMRRRNFIKPKAMPYTTPTGKIYDSGDFDGQHGARAGDRRLGRLQEARGGSRRSAGKLRGIGIATYIEACGGMGPETATVTLDKDGGVTVADRLAIDRAGPRHRLRAARRRASRPAAGAGAHAAGRHRPDRDRRRHRRIELDSRRRRFGRDAPRRSSPDNLKELAADALEAAPATWKSPMARCGSPAPTASISFADLAAHPKATPDKLARRGCLRARAPTYPNGTHIVEIEIDPGTGATEIVNYVVVDDFGVTLNPLLLAGQVHGGAVQGIGQALMEDTVYDADSGQLLTRQPDGLRAAARRRRAGFHFETRNVPCKTNPLGVKGAGEAGAIGSCPAVMNAMIDALWRAYRHPPHRHAGDAAADLGARSRRPAGCTGCEFGSFEADLHARS